MTPSRYVAGLLVLLGVIAAVGVSARSLRRLVLSRWMGPPARLAEAVAGIAVVCGVAQLLGAVGWFRTVPFLVCTVTVAVVLAVLAGRPGNPEAAQPDLSGSRSVPTWETCAAIGVTAVVTGQWATRVASALRHGMHDTDTVAYHLPMAGRFVQEGWLTRIFYLLPDDATRFHPANAETLHAVGILLLGTDVLSPLLNLGWLALLVLAAWCAGRPLGVGPAAAVGALLIAGSPLMTLTQPGAGTNDVAAAALLLTVVAFLVAAPRQTGAVLFAGAAAGLAVATKLTVLPAVAALSAGVLATAKGWRRRALLTWSLPVLATGSYWYARNLWHTGNPLPALGLGVGSVSLPRPPIALVDRYGFSVADYLTDLDVWEQWLLPGMTDAFGPAWPLLLVVVAGGLLLALRHRDVTIRLLAAAGLAAAAAYPLTPTSAFGPKGQPYLFAVNLRYLTPALFVGLVLVPAVFCRARRSHRVLVMATLVVVFLIAQAHGGEWSIWRSQPVVVALAASFTIVAVATLLALARRRPPSPLVVGAGAALLLVGAGAVGWLVQERYLRGRYSDGRMPAATWARHVHDTRIATAGFFQQYPLYGLDVSNRVQYVGARGPHGEFTTARSCEEWRRALRRGRYRYVVTSPPFGRPGQAAPAEATEPREAGWTRGAPQVTEVSGGGLVTIFRVDQPLSPRGCAQAAQSPAPSPPSGPGG